MSAVAIRAYCGFRVATGQCLLMNAVQRGVVFILVTPRANGVALDGVLPSRCCADRSVGVFADIRMTLDTGIASLAVGRCKVRVALDGEEERLPRR